MLIVAALAPYCLAASTQKKVILPAYVKELLNGNREIYEPVQKQLLLGNWNTEMLLNVTSNALQV